MATDRRSAKPRSISHGGILQTYPRISSSNKHHLASEVRHLGSRPLRLWWPDIRKHANVIAERGYHGVQHNTVKPVSGKVMKMDGCMNDEMGLFIYCLRSQE